MLEGAALPGRGAATAASARRESASGIFKSAHIHEPDLVARERSGCTLRPHSGSWGGSEYNLTALAGHIRMLAIIHAGRASLSCHETSCRQC